MIKFLMAFTNFLPFLTKRIEEEMEDGDGKKPSPLLPVFVMALVSAFTYQTNELYTLKEKHSKLGTDHAVLTRENEHLKGHKQTNVHLTTELNRVREEKIELASNNSMLKMQNSAIKETLKASQKEMAEVVDELERVKVRAARAEEKLDQLEEEDKL